MAENGAPKEIPKKCKGGVVVNEGPDFRVEVQEIDVPEPGSSSNPTLPTNPATVAAA
jgi:hypothetical protein